MRHRSSSTARWVLWLFAWLASSVASGCAGSVGSATAPSPAIAPVSDSAGPALGNVWFLADNQFSNLAARETRSRWWIVDSLLNVAVRPPELDLWSEVLFAEMLASTTPGEAVVHLGDAANLSCVTEFEAFLGEVRRSGRSVYWTPGNHDGFYMGNLLYPAPFTHVDPERNTWEGACYVPPPVGTADRLLELECLIGWPCNQSHARLNLLPKSHAILLYLDHLRGPNGPLENAPDPIEAWSAPNCPGASCPFARFDWTPPGAPSTDQGLERVVAALVPGELCVGERPDYWKNFLIQLVRVKPGLHVLLLDTSDFVNTTPRVLLRGRGLFFSLCRWVHNLLGRKLHCSRTKSAWFLPGDCGDMSEEQRRIANEILDSIPRDELVVVAGHHPIHDLRKGARKGILDMLARTNVVLYVSGHTHAAASFIATEDAGQPEELNVGSTSDWPMEFGRLTVTRDGSAGTLRWCGWSAEDGSDCDIGGSLPVSGNSEAEGDADYSGERYVRLALEGYRGLFRMIGRLGLQGAPLPFGLIEVARALGAGDCGSEKACLAEIDARIGAAIGCGCGDDVRRAPRARRATPRREAAGCGCTGDVPRRLLLDLRRVDRHLLRESAAVRDYEIRAAQRASRMEHKGQADPALRNRPGLPAVSFSLEDDSRSPRGCPPCRARRGKARSRSAALPP